jgi:SAM-dependent methyltransferase
VRRAAIFGEATELLADRLVALLDPQPGETVLELAAGIGETGFAVAERLGEQGRLLSSDAAPEMVDAARRRAAELGVGNAEFMVLDAEAIELDAEAVDGVLCRFGIMLVPSPERAVAEIARVIRPGGRVSLAVWASPDENDWMTAAGRSAVELGLVERPDPRAPGPFRFADVGELCALLERSGLSVATVEDVPVRWRAPSLDAWWETVVDMSPTLGELLAGTSAERAASLRRSAEARLAPHVEPDGSLAVPGLARALLAVAGN